MKSFFTLLLSTGLLSNSIKAQTAVFPLVTAKEKVTILFDRTGPKLDSISAHLLADDIERVSSYRPVVTTDLAQTKGNVIVIGSVHSQLMKTFSGTANTFFSGLKNKWECYGSKVIEKPTTKIAKALLIAGSDTRGTAYGVFSLSELIGVSPWYWWADVPVAKQQELIIRQPETLSAPPSVTYRGIFINDEDWGLLPWASRNFESEKNNIGPKTYTRVFELLLRLKANLIWPAMHPGSMPFFTDPENKKAAEAYAIIIGSSHAEPMLRNNVGEWDEKTMGKFNYITNREKVYQYWEERVKESSGMEAMFSLGMRGVHDSGMEGVKNEKEAVPLLEKIFEEQRGLLKKHVSDSIEKVPQVFTAYKEVLDIYDNGLQLPKDVTLVWPDDNYGYIKRLNTPKEKNRPGGTGVYYHASYWGRPHDYLWLGTTHPSLIQAEMMKAYNNGADRIWVLNVGDIKPLEYGTQLFLDMAYHAKPFKKSGYARMHMQHWLDKVCKGVDAASVAAIMEEYYDLAFERRPEFMGWSQTEPTTQTNPTAYNHFSFGDEAQRRLNRFAAMQKKASALFAKLKGDEKDAFYQLVYYPVVSATWMNQKFLYWDKANLYAKQNRISAYDYAVLSRAAYDSIVAETKFYNQQLRNGKWNGIMSMEPRGLPVFRAPKVPVGPLQKAERWNVVPEGYDIIAFAKGLDKSLPVFLKGVKQHYFIDVFLSDSVPVNWTAKPSANWILLSQQGGKLEPLQGKNTVRLWVGINWEKVPKQERIRESILFSGGGRTLAVHLQVSQPPELSTYNGFVETNGYVSIHAGNISRAEKKKRLTWEPSPNLGHTNLSFTSTAAAPDINMDTASLRTNAPFVAYEFYSFSVANPSVNIYTLPTHPLNNQYSMRYGVSIDDGPITIVDCKTIGRSEEWKQNVLRNSAIKTVEFRPLLPGRHSLTIYAIDPGVVLDRILITFGKVPKHYGVIPETSKE